MPRWSAFPQSFRSPAVKPASTIGHGRRRAQARVFTICQYYNLPDEFCQIKRLSFFFYFPQAAKSILPRIDLYRSGDFLSYFCVRINLLPSGRKPYFLRADAVAKNLKCESDLKKRPPLTEERDGFFISYFSFCPAYVGLPHKQLISRIHIRISQQSQPLRSQQSFLPQQHIRIMISRISLHPQPHPFPNMIVFLPVRFRRNRVARPDPPIFPLLPRLFVSRHTLLHNMLRAGVCDILLTKTEKKSILYG